MHFKALVDKKFGRACPVLKKERGKATAGTTSRRRHRSPATTTMDQLARGISRPRATYRLQLAAHAVYIGAAKDSNRRTYVNHFFVHVHRTM
jgi:hypothetical protein